jgi:5-methylcytosine-specific restriction endonuclease McrA
MNYNELLKTHSWELKRKEVLERDNYHCTKCGSKGNLNVHHIHYVQGFNPINQPICTMESLCFICHKKEHESKSISSFVISRTKFKKIYGFEIQTKRIKTNNKIKSIKQKKNWNMSSSDSKLQKLYDKINEKKNAYKQKKE